MIYIHTLAQKHLIELLMWNASHVHKQSIKVWQEKMVDPTWNSVWGMLSTSLLWGRFWCSRTIQIVSKVLPDCDISAVKRKFKWTTWRFLGLASSHFWKNWQVRHGDQPWYHKHWIGVFVGTWPIHAPGAPCKHSSKSSRHKTKPSTKQRKFYICADGPHTRLAAARLLLRFASGKCYYPFPEAEMASKYREESSIELILKLTRPRREMPPCDGLGPTMFV